MKKYRIYNDDNLNVLKRYPDNYFDSVVTDPPYGLKFMGKDWDSGVPGEIYWREALRTAKPGAYLVAFGGTRTYHRLMVAIEDAGWTIRDCLMWVYSSGMPKSYNASKAFEKMKDVNLTEFSLALMKRRLKLMTQKEADYLICGGNKTYHLLEKRKGRPLYGPTAKQWKNICKHFGQDFCKKWEPLIKEHLKMVGKEEKNYSYSSKSRSSLHQPSVLAKKYSGYGTAVKPAWEPIILAQKPVEGNIVQNVRKYGTGVLNIDGSRIGNEKRSYSLKGGDNLNKLSRPTGKDSKNAKGMGAYGVGAKQVNIGTKEVRGRWPANVAHDGSKEVQDLFPTTKSGAMKREVEAYYGTSHTKMLRGKSGPSNQHGDAGSAARFFYCAKVSRKERNLGLENAPGINIKDQAKNVPGLKSETNNSAKSGQRKPNLVVKNDHPTVKPLALMKWLVGLTTPHKNRKVLDPFMGSGSTGMAAAELGHKFVGIEIDKHSAKIALKRVKYAYTKETHENPRCN